MGNGGGILGCVTNSPIAASAGSITPMPYEPAKLISHDSLLTTVLVALTQHVGRFVVSEGGVTGILTRADLQRPVFQIFM